MVAAALLALDDPAARDPEVAGVKAAGLAAAADAGLPVLPGWVLPMEASAVAIAQGARALERSGPPGAYLAAMETAVPAAVHEPLPSSGAVDGEQGLFVVRSSTSRDDDGRWSGAFASYLGVDAEDLPTAIRGCWASAFSGDVLGRCRETGDDAATLRVGVLIQPFLRLDAGGTARVRPDGGVDVAAAEGGPAGVVGGRHRGRDVTVAADGRIDGEPGSPVTAATVATAAALARRAAVTVAATQIEWGAVGEDVYLLQLGPARAQATSSGEAPRVAASLAPAPRDAERIARLVTAFPGPLADELVVPWALGAVEIASLRIADETRTTAEASLGDHAAGALAEARSLAADVTARVWGTTPELARERTAGLIRLLLEGRLDEGVMWIAGLEAPDPLAARRVVGLVRGVGELLASDGILPSARLVWRLTGSELDRAIAGARPVLRSGPGRWEAFVADVVRSRGHGSPAVPVSPGIGAGRLRPLRALRTLGRPGPREVLVAPLPLPHLAPLLWHCAALVTTGGTSGAHLFEVARSLGVPAVIGADAGALEEAGALVAVDGDTGIVSVLPALEPSGTSSVPAGGTTSAMV
jgi:phosphohistidine swiveling domain-containing protein